MRNVVVYHIVAVILAINNTETLWEKPVMPLYRMHTELELPVRKQVNWREMKKERDRGQRSVP